MKRQRQNSRDVSERIFVTGLLELQTPAHFGNGDGQAVTDIPLLHDALEQNRPLLTGASIAGALRNYLREAELGYGRDEKRDGNTLAEKLFGHLHTVESASYESWLMVDDVLGEPPPEGSPVEIRDGVAIDPRTRTAEVKDGKGFKYDLELLAAGTRFRLNCELWLGGPDAQELLNALAIALKGFEDGKIRLGLRKQRGYGQCKALGWKVWRYRMSDPAQLTDWLEHNPDIANLSEQDFQPGIYGLLGVSPELDNREAFILDGVFQVHPESSLLIRSDAGYTDAPDMVHLRSWRDGVETPILSGTSLAGVLRSRAYRIAKTFKGEAKAVALIDGIFGRRSPTGEDTPTGSRLLVSETEIKDGVSNRVQNRVKIDRFTGGAYPQALFAQQPVFAGDVKPAQIEIHLELRKTPQVVNFKAEVGLLLLLLKDLWTGDLPIGGESSVGRGRLSGQSASLKLGKEGWELHKADEKNGLEFKGSDPDELEKRFVKAFWEV